MNFRYLYALRLVYILMIGSLSYMLFLARSGEIYTVWETLPTAFLPAFFVASVLLLLIVFSSSEEVRYKLLFVIVFSILSHSFSAIVFPAGGIGPQQGEGLSITRLMFDSTVHDGWAPWPPNNILVLLFNWFRGENFQSTLSIIFARMLGVDVYWTHVWLSPILWGMFLPIIIFAVTRILGGNETTSIVASLLITAFPLIVLWGTFSVPNSLGYIFFLLYVLFLMKYLSSPKLKVLFLMATFFVASILSHLLTGIVALSLLLLAVALKAYESEKKESPLIAKTSLVSAFLLSTILLPFALLLQRIVYPRYTSFSLYPLGGFPITSVLSLFLIGEYASFNIEAIPVFLAGPLLGIIGLVYILRRRRKEKSSQQINLSLLLVSLGYLMVLIDYRILKLFMVNVPFGADRMFVFEYLLIAPFVAFVINGVFTYLHKKSPRPDSKRKQLSSASTNFDQMRLHKRQMVVYIIVTIMLASWLTGSVYYAYPHYGFLQITDYEIEAARYIETNTNKTYIVICDQWFAYAGGMLVGVNNTCAFYFGSVSRAGIELFNSLKEDPSVNTMNKTLTRMERDGSHFEIIYFLVEEPRLGTDEFNRVVTEALENNLKVYYKYPTSGEAKLYIFYYER